MKDKKKLTPYLKINGKPIAIGTEYWTVKHTHPFLVRQFTARHENNVGDTSYYLSFLEADNHSDILSIYYMTCKNLTKLKLMLEAKHEGWNAYVSANSNG